MLINVLNHTRAKRKLFLNGLTYLSNDMLCVNQCGPGRVYGGAERTVPVFIRRWHRDHGYVNGHNFSMKHKGDLAEKDWDEISSTFRNCLATVGPREERAWSILRRQNHNVIKQQNRININFKKLLLAADTFNIHVQSIWSLYFNRVIYQSSIS